MAWSTRELAELAGTSLRTVRHYHDVGLLPEPERRANGYKQYGVRHLIRLLRIKRLVDLGFSLPHVAELGEGDEHPEEALRALDGELLAQIERLEHRRAELAEILEQGVPTDLPAEFAAAREARMSDADRTIVSVLGRVLGDDGRAQFAPFLDDSVRVQSDEDFDVLAPDADEDTRHDLAVRMADRARVLVAEHPGVRALGADAPAGPTGWVRTLERAYAEVYNPAQRDVLARMNTLLRRDPPT